MKETTTINSDTCVIMNYLYSTILPNATNGEAEFEDDKGCREYFESDNVQIVVGGKVVGEVDNLCERRELLYEDMADFITETGKDIFEYSTDWDGKDRNNSNDSDHILKRVQMNMYMHETPADQISVIRRCFQQMEECKREIMEFDIDDTFDQFYDVELRNKINQELNVNHDAEVLVDAAYIEKKHGVAILISKDSDITDDVNQKIFLEIIQEELGSDVDITIIDPEETPLEELQS